MKRTKEIATAVLLGLAVVAIFTIAVMLNCYAHCGG